MHGNLSEKVLSRLGKNPEAATEFLPDRDREKFEEATRKQIELEYEIRQQVHKTSSLCQISIPQILP